MPRRKKPIEHAPNLGSNTPTQQDEKDILQEVEAEIDDDGNVVASEEAIKEIGAVDAESVRENRRLDAVVGKKRANQSKVSFNTSDPLVIYDTILKAWGANSVDIIVRRLTGGSPVTHTIVSRPRSGIELHEALKQQVHRDSGEAEYEVKFIDSSRKEFRGTGRITMPDMRPPGQQGPTMNPFYPYGYPPPGYTPYAPPGAPQPPQAQQPPAAPAPFMMPAQTPAPDMAGMLATFQQMFDMFRGMQMQMQPPGAPPPPPPDPNAMLAWMRQMMGGAPMPAAPAPLPVAAPPAPSMNDTFALFKQMLEMVQSIQPRPAPQMHLPAAGGGGPTMGGYPQPMYRRAPGEQPQYGREQGPRTPAQQFQDAVSVVRSAAEAVEEFQSILPGVGGGSETPSGGDDDDSPIRVIETGAAKILVNRKDGGLRAWETAWANMDKILKWGGEQIDRVNQAHAASTQTRVQLPEGYVEVTPGYRPPPGYVAVPVDRLPPPPSNVPPPVRRDPAQQPPWGPPPSVGEEQ